MIKSDFSNAYKIFSIILACVQNMTLGGVLFGWASISGSLLISDRQNGGPGLSSDYVHMMFVIATFFNFLGPLLLGILLDNYGPRICSLVSICLITSGCILFAISDKDSLPLFIPAMCLIAFGGPGAQSSIIHLSNLFPTWKATATAFITGSFQLSFIVFLVFDQLWVHLKLNYSTLFMGYCSVCFLNAIISMTFWPDVPYSYEEQIEIYEASPHRGSRLAETDSNELDEEEDDEESNLVPIGHIRLPSVFIHHKDYKKMIHSEKSRLQLAEAEVTGIQPLKDRSLNEQIKSPEFLYLSFFFLVNAFWANFYIGTFDAQLRDDFYLTAAEEAMYARVFTITITCGVFGIPLVGLLMDTYGFPITSALTIVLGGVWAILLCIRSQWALLVSFVFYALYRTFFFIFYFAYLADTLGFKYFGVLAGVAFVLGGVLSFLQYPLAEFSVGTCHDMVIADRDTCSRGQWFMVNSVMAISIFSTLAFSYRDWISRSINTAKLVVQPQKLEPFVANQKMPSKTSDHNKSNNLPLKSSLKTSNANKKNYGSV